MNSNDERDYAEENANRAVMEEEMETEQEKGKQTVWRNISKVIPGGYYVFEVMEVTGDISGVIVNDFLPTCDGGYIALNCFHFFTEKGLNTFRAMDEDFFAITEVIQIPNLPTTEEKFCVYCTHSRPSHSMPKCKEESCNCTITQTDRYYFQKKEGNLK